MSRISFLQMKQFIAIAFVLCLFSCKKKRDWTCTCQVTGNNFGTFTKTINYETQKNATDQCGAYGKELMGSGGNYNCSIKGED
jgi:hypothetical protein